MRELYAEAREAAVNAKERQLRVKGNPVPSPTGSPPSSIDWWRAQYENAGRLTALGAAEGAKEDQARPPETAAPNRPWIIDRVNGHTARKG